VSWKRSVGYVGGLFLGTVLLLGAVTKAVDPLALAEQVRVEGLDFFLSDGTVAFVALGLEFALGTALILGVRRLWVLVPAVLLVAFFLLLTGRSYWNFAHGIEDESVSCGCFGNLVDRSPAEAFWQDLLLMVPALLVAFVGRSGSPFPWKRLSVAALVTATGLLFAWKAPDLPLDDLATRLKPGKQARDICAGTDQTRICLDTLIPELDEGEHVVVLAELSSQEFGEAVDELNQYFLSGEGPTLWVLSAASPEEQHQFFWTWAPTFEIREAPRGLIRPLYRTLPRSFLVYDGEVKRTFSGLPPLETLADGPET
jgi:uncharacterized membrane protein YphA (DoxX/SURF4 family)